MDIVNTYRVAHAETFDVSTDARNHLDVDIVAAGATTGYTLDNDI